MAEMDIPQQKSFNAPLDNNKIFVVMAQAPAPGPVPAASSKHQKE